MKTTIMTVVALAITTSFAQATDNLNSGNNVYQYCNEFITATTTFMQGVCVGEIKAILSIDPTICAPRVYVIREAVSIVVNFLYDHPERRNEDLVVLAAFALESEWPCANQIRARK